MDFIMTFSLHIHIYTHLHLSNSHALIIHLRLSSPSRPTSAFMSYMYTYVCLNVDYE